MRYLTLLIWLICNNYLFSQQLGTPVISVESGVYSSDITLSIAHPEPGVTLFYTLNGSVPTPLDNVYAGPLTMSSRIGDPDNYALIKTNPSFVFPVGDYDMSRANNRGWLAPYVSEIFKVNVLRVKAYKAGYAPSEVATKTYIIDPIASGIYSMPVVSIICDSMDLFSGATGIYKFGDHPWGNYAQKGEAWERLANFEYFEEDGTLAVQREVRIRIHGGGSRHAPKKTFRVYAEHDGYNNFNYEFFEGYEQDKYKRILLRTGGHRLDCFPRDNLANFFTEGLNVDQQHYDHVIVFLNGEYWGIHSIKERVDKYFIQNHYGIDDNEITILDQEYDVQDGYSADSLEMSKIEARADTSDMSDPANYKWITDRIDINNYIDYMASEIFLSNEDWVYSNIVFWRKTGPYTPGAGPGHDGKFRWIFYDFDGAFGGSCNNAYYTVNTLANATVSTGIYSTYTRLFRGLLENETFRNLWINRTCDLLNSNFKKSVLQVKLDDIYNELAPEIMEDVERWRYPSVATTLAARQNEIPSLVQWDTTFYYFERFIDRRQRKVREHILDKWGFPDTSNVTINVNDPTMGAVQINTLLINQQLPGVDPGVYPWVGQYIDSVNCQLIAIAHPGYEFVEWLETGETNDTIFWTPTGDTTYTAVFQPRTDYEPIRINELMASNSNYLSDQTGDYDDWLELFNPNPYPVNLSNCSFVLGSSTWYIPSGTSIEAHGYLLFWCDNEVHQGPEHVNFKLTNANNPSVYLFNPDGNMIDFVTYPQNTTNYSWGRYPNGSATFGVFSSPTPRLNNDLSHTEKPPLLQNTLTGHPNPAASTMTLNKTISYQIFSLAGQMILRSASSNKVDINALENGTYVLRSDEGEVLKIIVNKN